MLIDGNKTLGQVAQFLSSKGDQKILAKHVQGGIELYAKPKTTLLDKLRTTKYEGTKMTRAAYKKQLAKDTIKTLVSNYNNSVTQQLEPGRQRAKLSQHTVSSLTHIFENVDQNLLNQQGALRSNYLTNTFGAMERMKERVATILDRVVVPEKNTAMPLTNNHILPGEVQLMVPPENKLRTFPHMNIDGKDFIPEQALGEGGNGSVVRYRALDGEVLAVKVPVPGFNATEQKAKALEEYHLATRVTVGNPNVIGFNKVIPIANGGLALAGKLAPHGDLEAMRDKLKNVTVDTGSLDIPPPPGKISKRERELIALTLIKDTANGLDKMKREANHMHVDMKSQNVMIGSDGQAIVIDLGESVEGNRLNPNTIEMPANPGYRAPEVREIQSLGAKLGGYAAMSNKQELRREIMEFVTSQNVSDQDFAQVSSGWFGLADALAENLQPAVTNVETERLDIVADSKLDTWGLGTVAYELLVGERLSQDKLEVGLNIKYFAEMEKSIERWAKSGAEAIGTPNGLSSKSTGDRRLDSLVNGMLHSDPGSRPTANQVKSSPLMERVGVGSPEVRELIKAIASGDEGQISRARQGLARLTGTV